jgi:hypothetical protein
MAPRRYLLLGVEPLITQIMYWSNGAHQLVYRDLQFVNNGVFRMLVFSPQIYYRLQTFYSFFWSFSPYWSCCKHFSRFATGCAPRLCSWLRHFTARADRNPASIRLFPWPFLDLTPFTMAITGFFFALAMFRYQLLDMLPVAHTAVIRSIAEAVLVLDLQDRIIEGQPGAQSLFAAQTGTPMQPFCPTGSPPANPAVEQRQEIRFTVGQVSPAPTNCISHPCKTASETIGACSFCATSPNGNCLNR